LKLWSEESLGMTCNVNKDFASNLIKLKRNCNTKKELGKNHSARNFVFEGQDEQKDEDECLMFTQQHECSSYYLQKRKQM
jgi:adenine specific DNA methylase Mod